MPRTSFKFFGDADSSAMSQDYLRILRQIQNPFDRRIYFCAVLTKELEPIGVEPVVVGGTAVSFYTAGGYVTGDVDLVCPDRDAVVKILEEYGFKRFGRHWYHEDLDIAIEIFESGDIGDREKMTTVEIGGLRTYLLSVEDAILNRLNAYVHWKSLSDDLWIKEMMRLHSDKIDWEYLELRSREQKVYGAFKKFKGETEDALRKLRRSE
jgi:predicted nucleotidyltransferase